MKNKLFQSALAVPALFVLSLIATTVAYADDISGSDLLSLVFKSITGFGGLTWAAKVVLIVNLVIAATKVSFLRQAIWSKLGSFQALVAPVLGLVGAMIAYFTAGVPLSLPNLLAFAGTAAGAVILHEVLDGIKSWPGIGPIYVTVINFLSNLLGAEKTPVEVKMDALKAKV